MKYHRLKKIKGGYRQITEDDKTIPKEVDVFVWDAGYHNGTWCVDCQEGPCLHCQQSWALGECPASATQLTLF